VRSSFSNDAKPEVEFTEGAPWREGLGIEGDHGVHLIVSLAFFARQRHISTRAKPACMNITR
jgi:hypothetical protein